MSELEALWLGVVQGVTEFLPVSSSGHLVIFQSLFDVEGDRVQFGVVVHAATLISILLFYRRRIGRLVAGTLTGEGASLRYVGKLALASLPSVIAVLLVGAFFEAQFERPAVSGAGLLVTGCVLWTTRWTISSARVAEPGWIAALLIGCAQTVAILPGISRSGATVAAALALGVAPLAAAEFSFLLGSVAIAGAALRELLGSEALASDLVVPYSVGGAAALLSGVASIWLFVWLLRAQRFYRFAYYVWAFGAGFLIWLALSGSA